MQYPSGAGPLVVGSPSRQVLSETSVPVNASGDVILAIFPPISLIDTYLTSFSESPFKEMTFKSSSLESVQYHLLDDPDCLAPTQNGQRTPAIDIF